MSRSKLAVDEKLVRGMAKSGATNREIADFVECSESTISVRFRRILAKERAGRKMRLRQLQWAAAERGSVAMLIWLGKQMLGQAEQPQIRLLPKDLDQLTEHELDCISRGELSGITRLRLSE